MRKAIYLIGLFSLASAVFAADPKQSIDPFNGTWELNLAKSKFSPGPPPKSTTWTFENSGDTSNVTVKGVDAEGKPTLAEATTKHDGKEYPITGNPDADSASVKRINAFNSEASLKKDGKSVSTLRNTVSKNGKVLTMTRKGKDANGHAFNNVEVYDKQ
jgi:hypothetical protein